jgi:acyl-CoA thioester hydrolase
MSWRHTARGVVVLWECDDNLHLTVRNYLPKFDDSSYLLFFDTGLRMPELRRQGMALVAVSHQLHYIAELKSEAVFGIEAAIVAVGRTSVRSVQKMRNLDTGAVVATCVGVDALFDLEARRSKPWTADLRAMLEAAVVTLSDEDRALLKQ